jgi:hypothetical protein
MFGSGVLRHRLADVVLRHRLADVYVVSVRGRVAPKCLEEQKIRRAPREGEADGY